MRLVNHDTYIRRILDAHPEKDRTWAEHGLEKALMNIDVDPDEGVMEEVLKYEFGIGEEEDV